MDYNIIGEQKKEGAIEMETLFPSPSGSVESMFTSEGVSLQPQEGDSNNEYLRSCVEV